MKVYRVYLMSQISFIFPNGKIVNNEACPKLMIRLSIFSEKKILLVN